MHSAIKPPLTKNISIHLETNSLKCFSKEGALIASVPCVDQKLIPIITKGLKTFSSLIGHKLLRWQIKTGFENWIHGHQDMRLITTEGGFKGIARLIGCGSSHKAITLVKALLYAQAYGRFRFPDDSQGNMIILREMKRHKNGEPTRINIILGDMLLPNYTHLLPKGEKRRLIPIPELPPFIGSKNSHAAQALLQVFLLEEFSDQSKMLYERGYIHLTKERWLELSAKAQLPISGLEKVILGWIEKGFLRKVVIGKERNEYTLGKEYLSCLGFIELQGKQRKKGEKAGSKSLSFHKEKRA